MPPLKKSGAGANRPPKSRLGRSERGPVGGAKPRAAASAKKAGRRAPGPITVSLHPPEHVEDYASAARLFRALSHPLRVQIICGLLRHPTTQTGISRALGLSQSLVAQHLAVLRDSALVRGTRRGGEVVLEVADTRVPAVFAALCANADRLMSVPWEEMSGPAR